MSSRDAEPEDPAEAVGYWERFLARKPRAAFAWFNLGLAYKRLRDWPNCVRANRRALELEHPKGDPAWWNLGIAATALRDWHTARRAWTGYGLKGFDAGDGAPAMAYGLNPVRLTNGEVVWGDRIDPARIVIRNVPLPDSGRRWGEVVLHDGEPRGERVSGGRTYNVFDEIESWGPSEIPTYAVEVDASSDDDVEALVDAFDAAGFAAEDWSRGVRALCKACSEGTPGDHGHAPQEAAWPHDVGIAAPAGALARILAEWRATDPATRSFTEPEAI